MMERRLKPSAKVLSRVRVAEIRANPYQPRALFDEESIRALARSIEENGLLSPLLLRRSAGNGGCARFACWGAAGWTRL